MLTSVSGWCGSVRDASEAVFRDAGTVVFMTLVRVVSASKGTTQANHPLIERLMNARNRPS
ncbi:MAG: hypothetical protein H7834_11545 [Magnetococcus sp. YQC-9]